MNRVKLKVLGLSYSMSQSGAYALILSDESDLHRIPIIIGMPEAQSIAIQLEKIQTQRPLTHDLMKQLADGLDTTLKEVFVYRLDAGIFYSELLFEKELKSVRIDSRTSDAIALALRYACPIYTTSEIVEKAGVPVDSKLKDEQRDLIHNSVVNVEQNKYYEYSIHELKRLLDEAVRNEDYEQASHLRDLLKSKK